MASAKEDVFKRALAAESSKDFFALAGMAEALGKAYTSRGGMAYELTITAITDKLLALGKETENQEYLVGAHILMRKLVFTHSHHHGEHLALNGILDTERLLIDHPDERRKSLKAIIDYLSANSEYGGLAAGRLETLNLQYPEPSGPIRKFLRHFGLG